MARAVSRDECQVSLRPALDTTTARGARPETFSGRRVTE